MTAAVTHAHDHSLSILNLLHNNSPCNCSLHDLSLWKPQTYIIIA